MAAGACVASRKRDALSWIYLGVSIMKSHGRLERQMDATSRPIAEGTCDARLFAIVHTHKPGVGAAVDALVEHSGGLVDARDAAHTAQMRSDRGFRNPLDGSVECEIDMRP